jgi:hypothetical protein
MGCKRRCEYIKKIQFLILLSTVALLSTFFQFCFLLLHPIENSCHWEDKMCSSLQFCYSTTWKAHHTIIFGKMTQCSNITIPSNELSSLLFSFSFFTYITSYIGQFLAQTFVRAISTLTWVTELQKMSTFYLLIGSNLLWDDAVKKNWKKNWRKKSDGRQKNKKFGIYFNVFTSPFTSHICAFYKKIKWSKIYKETFCWHISAPHQKQQPVEIANGGPKVIHIQLPLLTRCRFSLIFGKVFPHGKAKIVSLHV